MLLRDAGDDAAVAIGQPAHAWVSGQLARAWGNSRFGEVSPHEDVCLAAEQHDIGMALWDAAPTLNPETGRPHTFMEMPLDVHLDLWEAAPARLLMQSRYAALLVSMHGTALYERRDLDRLEPGRAAAIRRYLGEQRRLQRELVEQLRADPDMRAYATGEAIARNQRLVFAWDWLSLALCLRWAPDRFDGVPTATATTAIALAPAGDDVVRVDPWPFRSERVEVKCEGRLLRGRFEHQASLRAAFERAAPMTLTFTLAPA